MENFLLTNMHSLVDYLGLLTFYAILLGSLVAFGIWFFKTFYKVILFACIILVMGYYVLNFI